MPQIPEPILELPETIRQDALAYRHETEKFIKSELSPEDFRSYRVPMGIYEQKTRGKYMVRIRIGAGLLAAYQTRKIAQLSEMYGDGILHVTTRQDVQIHKVDIEKTSDIVEQLLEVNLSTRGGGGNTVRNVTSCPRCGVCSNEKFNVAPYAIAVAEYLLQEKTSFTLPRKYKIVFSGCSEDCALASVADLGFFAKKKNGQAGFSVYAGGGLGKSPNTAVKIEDFIEPEKIFLIAEAIKQLFDEHGDRSNRNRARLRYVLKRLGQDEFVQLYRSYKEKVMVQGLLGNIPAIKQIPLSENPHALQEIAEPQVLEHDILEEKPSGYYSVVLNLKLGDISSKDLIAVANLSEKYGKGIIRTSQAQNLIISSVPAKSLKEIGSELAQLTADVTGKSKCNIVSCTGAATCKLGICLSRGLASAIADNFNKKNITRPDTAIRISGCLNSCGQHHISGLGLQGRAKRIGDRFMPCYDIFIGGKPVEGKAKLAEKIATIPAKSIPDMLADVFGKRVANTEKLRELICGYEDFSAEFDDDYYYDYGSDEPFTVGSKGTPKK